MEEERKRQGGNKLEERKKAREEVNWVTEDEEEFMYSLEGPRIEKSITLLSRERDGKIIIIWLCGRWWRARKFGVGMLMCMCNSGVGFICMLFTVHT